MDGGGDASLLDVAGELTDDLGEGVHRLKAGLLDPSKRFDFGRRFGLKAAGIAMLPVAWTPPFLLVEADVFARWRAFNGTERVNMVEALATTIVREAQVWSKNWTKGIAIRSSSTHETLAERGTNHSVQLVADFDAASIGRAISAVFSRFLDDGHQGSMALVAQALVGHIALGHMSNEQRVSKTINQWMWEYEGADVPGNRFNSQRDEPPAIDAELTTSDRRAKSLKATFRRVGRWCTLLGVGRCHIEWGATAHALWLYQFDLEDDQPDLGHDPTQFLRYGDFQPSGDLPAQSPFRLVDLTTTSPWRKVDKVRVLAADMPESYPRLVFITGDAFVEAYESGYDLAGDLAKFAHDRIVCRTDCCSEMVSGLNLDRTHTVTSTDAVRFMASTIERFADLNVETSALCFILHKFIPAVTAAWAVARRGENVARVDCLWGLPDGLQYLPHDTFEYDLRRDELSSETTRYKPAFLQETADGSWAVEKVRLKSSRRRSLPAPDVGEIAKRTAKIAEQSNADIQIMWFCQVPAETGLARNIPWFSMSPHTASQQSLSPSKKHFVARTMIDLDAALVLERSNYLLRLEPHDPELFRSNDFLNKVIEVATDRDFPVGLTGSILGHAFYMLEKAGLSVVALNQSMRSRTRQRRVFRKLVRDDIPERIVEGGETVTLAEIAKGEVRAALVSKLFEESHELLAADTPQDVTAELADMLEVIRGLADATGVEWSDVENATASKRSARGGFAKNVVLMETSWPGWVQQVRQSTTPTIPLSLLGAVTEKNGEVTIPYSRLVAANDKPVIKIAGRDYRVTMTLNGVVLASDASGEGDDSQIRFEFSKPI